MPRRVFWFLGWTLCLMVMPLACTRGVNTAGETQTVYQTVGHVANGPIQFGSWLPLTEETPDWVFPMIYMKWHVPYMKNTFSVEAYALKIVAEFKKRPVHQPIWLQTHNWLGKYRPGFPEHKNWDQTNIMAHEKDVTPQGTPGIWPKAGTAFWKKNMHVLLRTLKKHKVRLDFWPLDHETWVIPYAHNYVGENAFRNMVLDPRWKTEPILGLGIPGQALLDPAALKDELPWQRRAGGEVFADSQLAADHVTVVARFMADGVMQEVFTNMVHRYYPHAQVSDYRKSKKPIRFDRAYPLKLGKKEVWSKLKKVLPDLEELPGVGDVGSPPLYGQAWYTWLHPKAKDVVDAQLAVVDDIIAAYGDPEKVVPWVTLPNFTKNEKPTMTPAQYETLMLGLAKRGITRYILWFTEGMNTPEANKAFLAVADKMYAIAKAKKTS